MKRLPSNARDDIEHVVSPLDCHGPLTRADTGCGPASSRCEAFDSPVHGASGVEAAGALPQTSPAAQQILAVRAFTHARPLPGGEIVSLVARPRPRRVDRSGLLWCRLQGESTFPSNARRESAYADGRYGLAPSVGRGPRFALTVRTLACECSRSMSGAAPGQVAPPQEWLLRHRTLSVSQRQHSERRRGRNRAALRPPRCPRARRPPELQW
jgi:hypothetical protein